MRFRYSALSSPAGRTLAVLALTCTAASAADYYVSPTGSDTNPGTLAQPWKTAAKVSTTTLKPGDRVLFQGGQTFAGPLNLDSADSGAATAPVLITSYGAGQAKFTGANGIDVRGTRYLKIQNLTVTGLGYKTLNSGNGILITNGQDVQIDGVEVSQFNYCGIQMKGSARVRVTNAYAHHNGFSGIFAQSSCSYLYVGRCRAITNPGDLSITNNHSGNGILFYGTTDSVIEYCEAADNGAEQPTGHPGGPVGIWCASSSRITIQYCISHGNHSTTGDGGGFDLDGGTHDSVIQYCYSYDNKSSGYLMWEWGEPAGIRRNTIRYYISENDREGGFRFGSSGGGGVDGIDIYNNTVFSSSYPALMINTSGITNVRVRNNIFVTGGTVPCVQTAAGFTFQGNCYWRTNETFSVAGHSSLAAWAAASGQEKLNGLVVGLQANPNLINAGAGEKLTDPTLLPQLLAYRLPPSSPCIDRGLNLFTAFGIQPGTRDFWGTSLPQGSSFEIGACEVKPTTPTQAPTVATAAAALPNPVIGRTATLGVLGADDGGEAALTYAWATTGTPPAAVVFSLNGTNAAKSTVATFAKAGTYTLACTIRDAGGLTATSGVTVNVSQTLTSLAIGPVATTVVPGASAQFTRTGTDQFGAGMTVNPTWTVTGGGTIDGTGLFTASATTGGPYTVTATASGLSATAAVTISDPATMPAPVLHYALNEISGTRAVDSAFPAHDGTLRNFPATPWSPGRIGNALTFDGLNDDVETADATILDGMQRLTIAFWMRPTLNDGTPRGLISKRATYTSEYAYGLFLYTGGKLAVDLNGIDNRFVSNAPITTGVWTHVALVFDGSQAQAQRVRLYLNGTLDRTAGENGALITPTASTLRLGSLQGGVATYAGQLDEVLIYDQALSLDQVQDLAAAMPGGAG